MKISKISLLLCSIFLVFSLNADDKVKFKRSYKNLDYLNLSETQISSIKKSLLELKSEYKRYYKFKDDLEDDLEDFIKNDNFNEKLYLEKLIELKTKGAILEVKRVKIIHGVLNKKQRKKFSKYFKEWEIE